MADQFDAVVIGGGPGGYVAAIRLSQLGKKVALVEREHLGGICLNWGCIPTKALLRSAEVFHLIQHSADYGISVKGATFDMAAIVKRSRGVAEQMKKGIGFLMKKHKVTVFEGSGALAGKGKVLVTGPDKKKLAELEAKAIILATGARARNLPGLEADGKLVWDYRAAMVPGVTPKSLLVMGSGAIGIEFASFYNTLGVDVTVVELLDRVMPVEDEEISKFAQKQFEKQGMKIRTGSVVKELKKGKNNVTAVIEKDGKKESLTVDRVISAVGIVANTEGLGLEGTKVKLERGHIIVDNNCQTHEPGVYAIGDITGAPWLAHKASHEGVIAAEHIAGGHPHAMKRENIPGCTYCHPQVASVGLTEKAAKEKGYELKIGRFPFMGNGKAVALGEPEGLVKTIFDAKTGELLGAHLVGAEVTELVQGFVIGKQAELTEADFMATIFPHPTLSEMMHESVLDAYGRALHI
ncbi:MAG: dihydrolipoyl dehydrogenase [Rickettsiales bacterium]